jgi:hypothetical protein
MPLTTAEVETGLERAWQSFLVQYARLGGHNFYGFQNYDDPRNYKGPLIWSEGDAVYRFALELEREFPQMVHLEMPIARHSVGDYDPDKDKRQFVDVVVSDLRDFVEDEQSQERYFEHRHALFLEAKHFGRGSAGRWRYDQIRKVPAIRADAERLAAHLERKHCSLAAVLVVDDDDLFEDEGGPEAWPENVRLLLASPRELSRRGIPAGAPESCPACGSRQLVPVVHGLPSPELEERARRQEVVLAGCELFGDERDARWRCLNCGFSDPRATAALAADPEAEVFSGLFEL